MPDIQGEWLAPGTDEHEAMMAAHAGINGAFAMCGHRPNLLCAAFISFMAQGWSHVSDAAFEHDLSELSQGFRKQRAYFQSMTAKKS